jgi:MFS family permease
VRAALRLAVFRRLLAGYALNELAWAFGSLTLAVLVYRRTHSALGTAAFYLCARLVPAIVAPVAIARLDRRPAGRSVPVLYLIEAAAFAGLAWLAGRFALAPMLALALLDGTASIAASALTRAATVAVLGGAGLLREGNAVSNIAWSITYMAGPALAGLLVAADGTRAALIVNAALFAGLALNLASTGGLPGARARSERGARRLRAGLAYAGTDARVRGLLIVQLIVLGCFTVATPVEVIFAERSLRAGSTGYGWLLTVWGVGSLVGSALFARWHALPDRTLIAAGALLPAAGFVLMAGAPTLEVALGGALLGGAGNGIEVVAARTALQEATGADWMAIVMGLWDSLCTAAPGLGIVVGGTIAALADPRTALALAGAGGILAALACRRLVDGPPAEAVSTAGAPR